MKPHEFKQWVAKLKNTFPDTERWIEGLRSPAETLATWAKVMSDTDYAEACEAIELIASGTLPEIPAYDRERIPATIRRHAMELKSLSLSKLPSRSETWRDGFNCHACEDSGFRYVVSAEAMHHVAKTGTIEGFPWYRSPVMVRCSCERGYPRGQEQPDPNNPKCVIERTPRFSPSRMFPMSFIESSEVARRTPNDTSKDVQARFEVWMQGKRVKKRNYENEFDGFNQRKESA